LYSEDGFTFVALESDWRSVEPACPTTSSPTYPVTGLLSTTKAARAGHTTARISQGAVMANTQSQGKSRPIRHLSRFCACSWLQLAQTAREQTRIAHVQRPVRDACRPRSRFLEKRYHCPFFVFRSTGLTHPFRKRSLKNVHSRLPFSLGLP